MTKVLHIAATFAMVVGSELHEQAALPKDHFLLTSITEAAVSPFVYSNYIQSCCYC